MTRTQNDYFHPEMLSRLGSFELRARMIIEGFRSGMHESPHHGVSVEFAEHRQYVQGDDLRHLDWKVFGRSDKLYVKQFEQETNLDVVILVDSSASMNYGTFYNNSNDGSNAQWTKYDHATTVAAAMSYLALQQRDRVGLVVFADNLRSVVDRRSTSGHWRKLISALSMLPANSNTDIARCVDQSLSKFSNRALIVIISDFFDDQNKLKTAIGRIRYTGHDLILLHVLDRQEMKFDFRVPSPFVDLERDTFIQLDPRDIRQVYLEEITNHCKFLKTITRKLGFDYHLLDSHESITPALRLLLSRRISRIKKGRMK